MRLRTIEDELRGRVRIDWRSFLLRPRPDPSRTLEQFRAYTRSWLRPAAEPDAGTFRPWEGDAGPPSSSIPPHLVAKAAGTLGPEAFRRIHERLLHAYFAESRDITADATLRAVWREAGLPAEAFGRREDPALLAATLAEHAAAVDAGVTGVPAVAIEGREGVVLGAQPLAVFRRWIMRSLGP